MDININEAEMTMLAYLHEHATGFSDAYAFDPEGVMKSLEMESPAFEKTLSFLEQLNLVGVSSESFNDDFGRAIFGIWISGSGENFMREIEKAPGISRTLTVGLVKELWGLGKGVLAAAAVAVLTEYMKGVRH